MEFKKTALYRSRVGELNKLHETQVSTYVLLASSGFRIMKCCQIISNVLIQVIQQ